MNVFVYLTDVFDMTSPTVMEQRIKNAFRAGGIDFWENFFWCESVHPNDMIVYLFTEHQMGVLWNWWNRKITENSFDIRKNLNYSRQKQFRTARITPDGSRYVDRTRVCYVKSARYGYILKRVFFGVPPGVRITGNSVDFFEGGFRGEPQEDTFTDGDKRKELIIRLLTLRPELEKEFGGPRKNDVKWMRYLGPKLFDHKLIDYCADLNDKCPLVKTRNIDNTAKIL
jgi:hypothetical protein